MPSESAGRTRTLLAGGVLGFSFGGLIDVVVLHMILQWHHLLSGRISRDTVEGLQENILVDGWFAAAMLILAVIALFGVVHLLGRRDASITVTAFTGSLLVGFGLFNLVDEIVNHRLLGNHHINPGMNELLWDTGFLAASILLIAIGLWLSRSRS